MNFPLPEIFLSNSNYVDVSFTVGLQFFPQNTHKNVLVAIFQMIWVSWLVEHELEFIET